MREGYKQGTQEMGCNTSHTAPLGEAFLVRVFFVGAPNLLKFVPLTPGMPDTDGWQKHLGVCHLLSAVCPSAGPHNT